MLVEAPDFDHLSSAISHATAPAFMLGAVAGFLSILISRMERIVDRLRANGGDDGGQDGRFLSGHDAHPIARQRRAG
jgi:hypothetical protein